jgi:diguanylate cyclase (GGDEF)-like protein
MNVKDGLTGIYNRRYLQKRMDEELHRCQRHKTTLSLIMFDIDFFKKVNDTYGHQCGDVVLQSVAGKIDSSIRTSDCFARYGGEEFCCLLPQTDLTGASTLAERFRKVIEEMAITCQKHNINITISLGVAEFFDDDSIETLLRKADQALYQAKNSGRNRVVAAVAN